MFKMYTMKKKVVFFTARDLSNVGGGERMLSIVANNLCYEYDIIVITPYIYPCYYELNEKVNLVSLGFRYHKNSIMRKIQYIQIIQKIRHWMKTNFYDYFITSSSMAFLFISLISWKKDNRLYAWMQLSYYHPTPLFLKWIENISYRKFNIISINSMDMEIYKKYTHSVYQIPNPIPFLSSKKAALNIKRIISVGRLEGGKRFDLLIDICTNVFKKVPEWTLDIFGQDDGEKSALERLITERGMNDRIKIHNPTNDIKNEYLKSSVFATTTKIEAFSLVLLEASECGLPSISFDVPSGPRDIIENNYNGYLIKEGNLDTFEEKLTSLLLSYNLRKIMGVNAIEKAKKFDEDLIFKQWRQLLG